MNKDAKIINKILENWNQPHKRELSQRSKDSTYTAQFSSVAQSYLIIWDPMNRSMPGLPVHQQILEFNQTYVHQVGDAIQLSHPLSSPSPPAPNPSQHEGFFPVSHLFAWGGQSIGVSDSASVLPMNTQDWSLGWTGWISLLSKGLSKVFSNTTVQKHQFLFGRHSFLQSPTLTSIHEYWKNHNLD